MAATSTTFSLLAASLLVLSLLSLPGCGCGFDCNSGNDNDGPAILDLGFVDESLEQLKQVVIEVDRLTLRRAGEVVVVDTFTIDELGLEAAETFQMDLLQYRGRNQLQVFRDLEVASGTWSELEVAVLDGDVNRSFVQESDDRVVPLNIEGTALSVSGPVLAAGDQAYTLVFGLAQALRARTERDDYLLTTDGIRLLNSRTAASLSGRIDSTLFDSVAPCDAKPDPEQGNRIYLYRVANSTADTLADVHTDASSTPPPDGATAPFSVAALAREPLTGNWQYAFGFLPPDTYTLAFSCDAGDDDPVEFDSIDIPLPEDQLHEIDLDTGEQAVCDLEAGSLCS